MAKFLESLELTEKQHELVMGIAKRVALTKQDARKPGPKDASDWKGRVARPLVEAGIAREKLPQVFGAIERIAHEMKQDGDAFELDPGMAEFLKGLQLTEDGHKLVMRIAKRLSMAKDG